MNFLFTVERETNNRIGLPPYTVFALCITLAVFLTRTEGQIHTLDLTSGPTSFSHYSHMY